MIHKESMTSEEIINYLQVLKENYPDVYVEAKKALNARYGIEALRRGQEINEALEGFIKESWGCKCYE